MDKTTYEVFVYLCTKGDFPDSLKGPQNNNKRSTFLKSRERYKFENGRLYYNQVDNLL